VKKKDESQNNANTTPLNRTVSAAFVKEVKKRQVPKERHIDD